MPKFAGRWVCEKSGGEEKWGRNGIFSHIEIYSEINPNHTCVKGGSV